MSDEPRKFIKTIPRGPIIRAVFVLRLIVRVLAKSLSYRLGRMNRDQLSQEVGIIMREELGGLKGPLQKVGQMMAYLINELPAPMKAELRQLLITSKPIHANLVKQLIQTELKRKIEELFSEFDELPLATGSIGQIHRAVLTTGEVVAVKVRLPAIDKVIRSDMQLLEFCLPIIILLLGTANLRENFLELKKLVIDETNFLKEKDNILTFQKICANDPMMLVPRVFPEFCTAGLLVMEYINGVSFDQFVQEASQEQRNLAARIIWEFGSRSINRYCLFQADPHPGNYLFLADGRVAFVDFGFCKRWEPQFLNLWKLQTKAGVAGDLPVFTRVSKEMGIGSVAGEFDYQRLMLVYQKYSYSLWTMDQEVRFTHEFIRKQLGEIIAAQISFKGAVFPAQLLMMSRWFTGVQTIMADLEACLNLTEITWRYLEEETFTPSKQSIQTKRIKAQISKFLLGYLSSDTRVEVIRQKVRTPRFALDPRFEVVTCASQKEFEHSFRLLHEAYVSQGLMTANPDGLRCGVHSFLPETTTIIAKFNGLIVGTLSLILDSRFGLPSDSEYKPQIDKLRQTSGSRLVEVSAFAVDSDFRQQGNAVSLLLMKYLYFYAKERLKASHLICAVRKEVQDFYSALFLFDRDGPIVRYRAVNGTEGVFLSMEINEGHEELFRKSFMAVGNSNFSDFILSGDNRFVYPEYIENLLVNYSMTPEILEYFLFYRTRLLRRISPSDAVQLLSVHLNIRSEDPKILKMLAAISDLKPNGKSYRFPVHIHATLGDLESGISNSIIKDITPKGAFLSSAKWKEFQIGQNIIIKFHFLKCQWSLKGTIRWVNPPGANRFDSGIGISWNAPVNEFQITPSAITRKEQTVGSRKWGT